MNKLRSFLIVVIFALFFCIPIQNVFAANLNFVVIPNKEVNDTLTTVEARIDPQSKKINVVEGTIGFSGPAAENLKVQVENGNSVLPLWPTPPQYLSDEKIINFTGGIPDGFDKEGLLFSMLLSSSAVGDLTISYTDGLAYLNDGKGTEEEVISTPLQISFNQSSEIIVTEKENLFPNQRKYGIVIVVLILFALLVLYAFKKYTNK